MRSRIALAVGFVELQAGEKDKAEVSATRLKKFLAEALPHFQQFVTAGADGQQKAQVEELQQLFVSYDAAVNESIQALASNAATTATGRATLRLQQAATSVNEMTVAVEDVAQNAVSTSDASMASNKLAIQSRAQMQLSIEETLLMVDEVRALAYRTQNSTREIEQMVVQIQQGTVQAVQAMHNSSQRADVTLSLANEAGGVLELIFNSISHINDRNLLIATASEQQAHAAREVDRSLVTIRDLSLQTAAGADQTNMASRELSTMAAQLITMVQKFRT